MLKKEKSYSEHQILVELRNIFKHYVGESKDIKEKASTYKFDNPQLQFILNNISGMFGIIDFVDRKYLYINDSVEEVIGVKSEVFLTDGIAAIMSSFVPEEAMLFIDVIYPTIFEYFEMYAKQNEAMSVKTSYTTRLRLKDGTTKWFLHQIIPLEVDYNGMPIIALKLIVDVDGIKKDQNIDLIISKKDDKGIFRIVQEKSIVAPRFGVPITDREREVLSLTSQGMSAKEISQELYISQHTVINHKKNMLKKFNISSSSELVRFGMVNGLIG